MASQNLRGPDKKPMIGPLGTPCLESPSPLCERLSYGVIICGIIPDKGSSTILGEKENLVAAMRVFGAVILSLSGARTLLPHSQLRDYLWMSPDRHRPWSVSRHSKEPARIIGED